MQDALATLSSESDSFMSEDIEPSSNNVRSSQLGTRSEEIAPGLSQQEIKPEAVDIPSLRQELVEEKKKAEELSKRLLYLQSDIVNLQRQSDRRIAEAREEAKLQFIENLISIKEDLERAMAAGLPSNSALFDGLQMLIERIEGNLKSEDVEKVNASPGDILDIRIHEAVAYSETSEIPNGRIVSVVSNGYTIGGKVIRPALVEVARAKSERTRTEPENEIESAPNVPLNPENNPS